MEKRKQSSLLFFFENTKKKKSEEKEASLPLGQASSDSCHNINNEEQSNYKSNDVSFFKNHSNHNIEYLDILELIDNIWTPLRTYLFPSTLTSKEKFSRKFQFCWLEKYPWLAYSAIENAAYCKYCVFFAMKCVGSSSSQTVGFLVQEGYNNWKHSLEYFNKHNCLQYHINSMLHFNNLRKISEGKLKPIDKTLDENKNKEVLENRAKLKPIIKTIILCGRQGWALRGHKDYGLIELDKISSGNEGNFRTLLKYRVEAGDKNLEMHLRNAKKNALYTSPIIQNEILSICGSLIQSTLIKQIKASKYFSVLVDESTDISNIEQMSLCVRYVDETQMKICENFLCFVPLSSTTGESISNQIISTLWDLGLDVSYLRGQGYDGAAAMSGQFKGTQAYILKQQPKAIYVHCISHSLNLAISDSCNVQDIRNCFGIIEKTYTFLNTPKRQHVLSKNIDTFCSDSKKTKLKQLCPTRWVQRHDAILIFVELFEAICETLHEISCWQDRDSSSGAQLLFNSIKTVNFLFSIKISELLFGYSAPLSKYLQTENLDLSVAIRQATHLEKELGNCRSNADSEFNKIFSSVSQLCEKLDLALTIPRRNARQTHRANLDIDDPEAYYRASIFIPFLDAFIAEINSRFIKHKNVLTSFSCLLTNFDSDKSDENFKSLAKFYESDLIENGSFISQIQLECEFKMWKREMRESAGSSWSAIDMLVNCSKELFPNIYILLKIFCVIPVSTATPERSYSTLRRLKTYLRNSTGENRLTSLSLLNIYYAIEIDIEEVLNKMSQKARRLNICL